MTMCSHSVVPVPARHRRRGLGASALLAVGERLERLADEHLEVAALAGERVRELDEQLLDRRALARARARRCRSPRSACAARRCRACRISHCESRRDDLVVGALGVVRARGHRLGAGRPRPPPGRSGGTGAAGIASRGEEAGTVACPPASARRRRAACRPGPPSRNAPASVGPPSSRSDWTPSAASAAQLVGERARRAARARSRPAAGRGRRRGGAAGRAASARRGRRAAARRRARCPSRRRRRRSRRAARARAAGSPRPTPSARPGTVDPAVERDGDLVGDERPAARDPRPPRLVLRARLPASRRARPRRPPRAAARARRPPRGSGRATPATTRATPARERSRSVHGGVVPQCAHGSIVTKSVAPRARSPAASSATTSPCRPPASVTPSPTTSPSRDDDRADRRLRVARGPGGRRHARAASRRFARRAAPSCRSRARAGGR